MSFSDSDLDLDDDGVLRDERKANIGDDMVMDEYGIIHDATDIFGHFEPTQRTDSGLGVDKRSTTSTGQLTNYNLPHDNLHAYDINDSHPLDEKSLNISDFEDSTARESLKEHISVEHVSLSSQEEPELMFNNSHDNHQTSVQNGSHLGNGSHFEIDQNYQIFDKEVLADLKNQGVLTDDDFDESNGHEPDEWAGAKAHGNFGNGLDIDDDDSEKFKPNSEGDFSFGTNLKNQGVITDDDSHRLYSHSLLEFENLESKLAENVGEDPLADYLHKTPHRESGLLVKHELTFSSSNVTADGGNGKLYLEDDFTISEHSSVDHASEKVSSVPSSYSATDGTTLTSTVIPNKNFSANRDLGDEGLDDVAFPDSFSRRSTPSPTKIPVLARSPSPMRSRSSSPAKAPQSRGTSPSQDFKSRLPVRSNSPAIRNVSRGVSPNSEFRSRLPLRSESPARSSSPGFKSHVPSFNSHRASPRSSQEYEDRKSRLPVRSQSRQSENASPAFRSQSPIETEISVVKRHSYSNNRPRSRSASRANTPDANTQPESRSQSPYVNGSRRGSNEVTEIMNKHLVSSLSGEPKNSQRSNSAPVKDKSEAKKSSRPGSARLTASKKPASPSMDKLKKDMPKILANRPESPKQFKIKGSTSDAAKSSKLQPVRATQQSQDFMRGKSLSLSQSFSENDDHYTLSQLSTQSTGQRRQDNELVHQLQDEYDKLLEKYALAEVTIDHLKLGAKIQLHSDPPTPAQASRGVVSAAQKSQMIHMPTVGKAQVGNIGQPLKGQLHSAPPITNTPPMTHQAGVTTFPSHHGSFSNSPIGGGLGASYANQSGALGTMDDNPLLTATTSGECAKIALIFQSQSLHEQLDSFKTLMEENQLTIDEQENVYERIKTDFEKLQDDYRQAREEHDRIRRQNVLGSGGSEVFFDDDKSLEGDLFKLSMKLEGVHEQVEDNLRQRANQRLPFQEDHMTHSKSGDILKQAAAPAAMPPIEPQADHVTDLDNKVQHLLDEYNNLMSRYNNLKSLPASQTRDEEIDRLLKRIHEISVQSPQLLNVQLPEILPGMPEGGSSVKDGGGLHSDSSIGSRDSKPINTDNWFQDRYASSSAAEGPTNQNSPSKLRSRPRKPNSNVQKNVRNGHSSVPDSGVSTPQNSRKSVPRSGSHATTDGDSGFMGSEGSRQSGNQGKPVVPRLRGLKSSVKPTELSSVTSNQQEWSETDVSTTESVKPKTDARRTHDKTRGTAERVSSRASSRRGSVESTKKRRDRISTPDTEKSFMTQGSRATSRSSVKSERLQQLQGQIEQLRLEVQQSKQANEQETKPKEVTPSSGGIQGQPQGGDYDERDGQYRTMHQPGQSMRSYGKQKSGMPVDQKMEPLDDKYLRNHGKVLRGPIHDPYHNFSEDSDNYGQNHRLHDDRFSETEGYRSGHRERRQKHRGDKYDRGDRGDKSRHAPQFVDRSGGSDVIYRKQYGGERLQGPRDYDEKYESRKFDYPDGERTRRGRKPEERGRDFEEVSYGRSAQRDPYNQSSRRLYEGDEVPSNDRTYSRDYPTNYSTPKRPITRTMRDYEENYPLQIYQDPYEVHPAWRDGRETGPNQPPPLRREDLGEAGDFGTRTGNGYTLTKSPCPICAGTGTHTHAEFNPAHRPSHYGDVRGQREMKPVYSQPQTHQHVGYTQPPPAAQTVTYSTPAAVPPSGYYVNYTSTPVPVYDNAHTTTQPKPPDYSYIVQPTPAQPIVNPEPVTIIQPSSLNYPQTPIYNPTVLHTPVQPATQVYPTTPLNPATSLYQMTPTVGPPQQTVQPVVMQTPVAQAYTPGSSVLLTSGQPTAQQQPTVVMATTPAQLATPSNITYMPVELQPSSSNTTVTPSSKVRYYVREYREVDSDQDSVHNKRRSKRTKHKKNLDDGFSTDSRVLVVDNRASQPPLDEASRAALELRVLTDRMRTSLRDELNRSIRYTSSLPLNSTIN